MEDTDSYFLKCMLESIEEGVPSQEIQAKCQLEMGFDTRSSNSNEQSIDGEVIC